MKRIVECVPNISEGRDKAKIKAVTDVVETVDGVVLLDVDPGESTNRTVITFVGEPDAVVEAAFRVIQKAAELIDMRHHTGGHPRFGATDVCPFVPVSGISMEECAELAHQLGERVGRELEIPVYFYEHAATSKERRNLATVRSGEYEGLSHKLVDPAWKPDCGPAAFGERQKRSGATAISAREFLIAWNFNLNTRDSALAHDIALTVRESGRFARDAKGKFIRDAEGKRTRQDGLLKNTKAVGWYIDDFGGRAQISMNLTNYKLTPLHECFDTVCAEAQKRGMRVTGAEIVGLVPLASLLEAGRFYLRKQGKPAGVSERELVECAVRSMGLADLYPFEVEKKIVDYRVQKRSGRLVDLKINDFNDLLASDAMAPGGGSTAALYGALAASLAAMVANLTHGKKGYTEHNDEMDHISVEGQGHKEFFLAAVDRDTEAFDAMIAARRLPKDTEEAEAARAEAMEEAQKQVTLVPFEVVERCLPVLDLIEAVAARGNQNSLSDAGVAALSVGTACDGAAMNVRINLADITDKAWAADINSRTAEIQQKLHERRSALLKAVEEKLAYKG